MDFATAVRAASIGRQDSGNSLVVRARKMLAILMSRLLPAKLARERGLVIEERLSLGTKKMLVVVSCQGRRFLVGCGAESVSAILPLIQRPLTMQAVPEYAQSPRKPSPRRMRARRSAVAVASLRSAK